MLPPDLWEILVATRNMKLSSSFSLFTGWFISGLEAQLMYCCLSLTNLKSYEHTDKWLSLFFAH